VCAGRLGGVVSTIVEVRLYDATFSRTVWRLYDGAKGLVVWYYDVEYHERFLPNAAGRYIERVWSAAVPAAVAKQAAVLSALRSRVRQLDRIG
jgi:hypothetical protein